MSKVLCKNGEEVELDEGDLKLVEGKNLITSAHGYAGFSADGKFVLLHRFLTNAAPGLQVDHINGDRLDNRRSNLRLATHAQNQWNRGMQSNNTSGFKGVSYDKSRKSKNKWTAMIHVNNKRVRLGRFPTPIEASRAYDLAAQKHHGQFAHLNSTAK